MKKKRNQKNAPYRWAFTVFGMAVGISAVLSLASQSQSLLSGAGLPLALGIGFDIIGVAVTAADPKPLHAMASHKVRGAREALVLLKNASRVSSICNDVVGDICGIVSGVTAAVIVSHLQRALDSGTILFSVGVTALISGLTIGGKALSKPFAIQKGTQVLYWVGRFLHLFHRR